VRLLVLFDIDGTLFLTHDPLAGQALHETLQARFGVRLPDDAIEHVDHEGQTSLRIARLVLEAAGVDAERVGDGLAEWCPRFAERYIELLAHADTSGWRAAPGAEQALERLTAAGHRLALLTGNPEPMARARMERLGLARFFAPGQGAFGCDAELRADLIDLARARAGGWPADATVEIGDTARDASSAREAGVRSILVDDSGLAAVVPLLLA
jgi:phosphoglycolate phosphatase